MRRHPLASRLVVRRLLGIVVVSLSCADPTAGPTDPVAGVGPAFLISDGTHPPGRGGFYWLPPLVDGSGIPVGMFDAGLSPEIYVCEAGVALSACVEAPVKRLNGGSGAEALTVDLAEESYSATWNTRSQNLQVGGTPDYRLFAVVDHDGDSDPSDLVALGYLDLDVVAKHKDLKNVSPDNVGLVQNAVLKIKFRIQTTAVGVVTVTPEGETVTGAGATQDFTATGVDLHNVPRAGATVQWMSSSPAVADVAPSSGATDGSGQTTTTATAGGTGGQTTITASTGGVEGTATLTVVAESAPIAGDDSYSTAPNTTVSRATTDPDDLLDNDDPGVPAPAPITSFGGGSLGGDVETNAAGSTVNFGSGGSLTVNADGSFSFTPETGFTGSFTFEYRLTNGAPLSDEATVTIEVQAGPTATDDAPAPTSVSGDPYHAFFETTLNLAAPGVLSNDNLGFPAATLTSFGGGSLGGDAGTNAAGATVNIGSDGSLTVNADGSFAFTPETGFTGTLTFDYRLTNTVASDDGTVTLAVGARPAAEDDTYPHTLVGNVSVTTASSSGFSVLTNDAGDGIALAFGTATNGTATLNTTTGTFEFNPDPGFEGTATFTYTVTNGFGSEQGTVSIPVSGMIWFVDNSQVANGDGRLATPFNCLVSAGCFSTTAADEAGDNIFLYSGGGAYPGELTLLNNQRLIGQGASASLSAITGLTPPADSPSLPSTGGAAPSLITTVGATDALILGSGNTLRGFTIGNTTGSGISGAGFGTATISEVTISGSGQALDLSTGTLAGTGFSSISSSSGTNNIALTGVQTTSLFPLGSGALSGATGDGFLVSGQNGSFSYSGSIANTIARPVSISGKTGGTVNLSGAINGTADGILLSNNTGATINLSGTLTLSTGANTAFSATGGGTVTASGAASVLTTTTGVALNVANTTIGTPGLTFQSISAGTGASGPANGIVLNTTGSTAGLTVTGLGAVTQGGDGSGGTIQSTTGAGISLTNTRNPSFTNMTIQSTGGSGISGEGVTNFTFANGTITGSGDANQEANIEFNGCGNGSGCLLGGNIVTGVVTITNSVLNTAFDSGIYIEQTNGTISNLMVTDNSFTSTTSTATSKGDAMKVVLKGTMTTAANLTRATIANNVLANFPSGAGIQVIGGNVSVTGPAGFVGTPGSGTDIISITGNRISGQSAAARMGTHAIAVSVNGGNAGARSQGNFNVSNNGTVANPLQHTTGTTILVGHNGNADGIYVTNNNVIVSNNSVASQGIGGGNGIVVSSAETPIATWTINNNTISNTDGNGILAVGRGVTGTLNLKIQNNTVAAPLTGVRPGIRVDAGNAASVDDRVCLNISGNTTGGSGGHEGIGLRKQGTNATVNDFAIHGMAATSSPGVEQYVGNGVGGQNPGTANGAFGINGVLLISATSGFSSCSLP